MTTTADTSTLPTGTWTADPAASTLAFRSRGMFGLVPVKGTFSTFEGELNVDGVDITGELRITAASLNTGNAKRDTHLRSADFFDTDTHPTVSFRLLAISPAQNGGHELTGELTIRDTTLRVTAPVTIEHTGDQLVLATELAVDRAAAGVGWSKMGMIKGPAHLTANITVTR